MSAPSPRWHLAQINIGRIRAPITDPLLAGFVAELEPLNALADTSPGFVWRLQTEAGDATALRPYDDEMILINMSVWGSVEALKAFVYRTHHADVMRQREKWFERLDSYFTALWWIPAGSTPTVLEAKVRLEHLRENGESPYAFSFKKVYPSPAESASADYGATGSASADCGATGSASADYGATGSASASHDTTNSSAL